MAWKKGWSITKGRWETTVNPDGSTKELYLNWGPFYYNPTIFNKIFFCIGFRPTPPWEEGVGNEGIFPRYARWMKRHGWGNFAITIKSTRDRHRVK